MKILAKLRLQVGADVTVLQIEDTGVLSLRRLKGVSAITDASQLQAVQTMTLAERREWTDPGDEDDDADRDTLTIHPRVSITVEEP